MGKTEIKIPSEDLSVNGRTVLKCILNNGIGVLDWLYLAEDMGQVAGSCKHDNKGFGLHREFFFRSKENDFF